MGIHQKNPQQSSEEQKDYDEENQLREEISEWTELESLVVDRNHIDEKKINDSPDKNYIPRNVDHNDEKSVAYEYPSPSFKNSCQNLKNSENLQRGLTALIKQHGNSSKTMKNKADTIIKNKATQLLKNHEPVADDVINCNHDTTKLIESSSVDGIVTTMQEQEKMQKLLSTLMQPSPSISSLLKVLPGNDQPVGDHLPPCTNYFN